MNGQAQAQGAGWQPADRGQRIVAAAIDGGMAFFIAALPYVGGLIAAAYILVRDGLDVSFMPRQSLGKRLLGIQAVGRDGRPLDLTRSIQRNIPLAVAFVAPVFAVLPIVGGTMALILALCGAVLGIMEIVFVLTDPHVRRLGDKLADTVVVVAEEGARRP